MSKLERVANKKSVHIQYPYTLDEILDKIESDDYNPELMLQHLLLYMAFRHQKENENENYR